MYNICRNTHTKHSSDNCKQFMKIDLKTFNCQSLSRKVGFSSAWILTLNVISDNWLNQKIKSYNLLIILLVHYSRKHCFATWCSSLAVKVFKIKKNFLFYKQKNFSFIKFISLCIMRKQKKNNVCVNLLTSCH